ncbi:hydroxyisourate hydrolase [Glycomyces paridis]|uniref:5-hydroxyisourate hydrolase n=1 Tax=Glycomyces paridis TaxID=2126555 RepID=A0A4S8PN88_9ACTN|nr:hydroxyisourate hydrolase [Glycomyces paridis]THV32237.1 hydroxyisourate hydrolase [Glycomyces paridis]
MTTISSHVLDAVAGAPAAGLALALFRLDPTGRAEIVRSGVTDADGRVAGWETGPGRHRLRFDTGAWFAGRDVVTFYPEVAVDFLVTNEARCHVPLLLSPFAYSTYRGS